MDFGRFVTFSDACRQTLALYESADSESCSSSSGDSALQSRVDTVNAACCEQEGVNTCVGGAPQICESTQFVIPMKLHPI